MSATTGETTGTSATGRMAFARWVARILGIVVALLAVAGLFVEGEWLLGIANVDLTLDIARIVIAVALLWVGFGRVRRPATARG